MSKEKKIPTIVMSPEIEAQIAADPKLAKVMQGVKEAMYNAMQAVEDGRYPDFETAMAAMGHECEPVLMEDDD